MKKNKKIIILISIIIILAVIFSFFQIRKSYLFNADNNGIIDGKSELINRLEKIEDKEERKKQIDYSVYRDSIRLKKTKKKRYVLYRFGWSCKNKSKVKKVIYNLLKNYLKIYSDKISVRMGQNICGKEARKSLLFNAWIEYKQNSKHYIWQAVFNDEIVR